MIAATLLLRIFPPFPALGWPKHRATGLSWPIRLARRPIQPQGTSYRHRASTEDPWDPRHIKLWRVGVTQCPHTARFIIPEELGGSWDEACRSSWDEACLFLLPLTAQGISMDHLPRPTSREAGFSFSRGEQNLETLTDTRNADRRSSGPECHQTSVRSLGPTELAPRAPSGVPAATAGGPLSRNARLPLISRKVTARQVRIISHSFLFSRPTAASLLKLKKIRTCAGRSSLDISFSLAALAKVVVCVLAFSACRPSSCHYDP